MIDTNWFTDRLAQRGMSQRGLAKLMGLDNSAISLMFRGKRKMSLDEAAQLAVLLDTTPQEILERTGVRVPAGDRQVKVIGFELGDGIVQLAGEGAYNLIDRKGQVTANVELAWVSPVYWIKTTA